MTNLNFKTIYQILKETFLSSVKATFLIFKIIIPILILVKIGIELGLVNYIGKTLEPIMSLIGLPGEMGIVFALIMVGDAYLGLSVFFTLFPNESLSLAQINIFATISVMCHGLVLEHSILKQCKVRIRVSILLRVFISFLLGWITYQSYSLLNLWDSSPKVKWNSIINIVDNSLFAWILSTAQVLLLIIFFVFSMYLILNIFKKLKVIDLIYFIFAPLFYVITKKKDLIVLSLMILLVGIVYGAPLIIEEIKKNKYNEREVFLLMMFLSLSHSLIEETILFLSIGTSFSMLIFARLGFTFFSIWVIKQIIFNINDKIFYKYFFKR